MATELGLDPSDPLNLLLHNSANANDNSTSTSTSTSTSPNSSTDDPSSPSASSSSSEQDDPQWSSLSSLWDPTTSSSTSASADGSTKPYPEMMPMDMDFSHLGLGLGLGMGMGMGMGVDPSLAMSMGMGMGFGGMGLGGMGMDMDFASQGMPMVVDPSALHYDPSKFTSAHGIASIGAGGAYGEDQYGMGLDAADVLAAQFPFTFQFNHSNTHNSGEVASSSSSSSSSSSASSVADSPQSFAKERRLSTSSTSTSSVSGASLSPVPESLPSPSPASVVADTQPKVEEVIPTSMDISSLNSSASYENDPAAELAARVRAAAGVMLAVPMNAQLQGYNGQVIPNAHSKLPIPRLPRQSPPVSKSTPSSSSSAASTPPPTTPPLSNAHVATTTSATSIAPLKLSLSTQAPSYLPTSGEPTIIAAYTPVAPTPTGMTPTTGPTAGLGRPKTSHTTIERRYRTNLNARIQSLRMAVPALRVLEDRDGGNGKKIKKNLKGNVVIKGSTSETTPGLNDDGTPIDVIDERGFVDGVKVARKCSKANVLGKAVEYIRVLKKREMRLRREQEGLKKLIEGLVGGAALVKEWEREWRAVFGGEERDEVEGDGGEGGEGEGEGGEEDGEEAEEEEEEDEEEEEERKRKRARVGSGKAAGKKTAAERKKASAPAAVLSVPPAVVPAPVVPVAAVGDAPAAAPEKRKRGRPRKVVAPPAPAPVAAAAAPAQDAVMQDAQSQQWLQQAQAQQQGGQGQGQPQQYLLAVFALFSFFNSPLTSSPSFFASSPPHHAHTGTVLSAQPPLAYAPEIVHQFTPPPPSHSNAAQGVAGGGAWSWTEYMQFFHLFVSVLVLLGLVASWMGVDVGRRLGAASVSGGAKRRGRSLSVRAFRARRDGEEEKEKEKEKERRGQGPRGWVGVGEESVLGGRASSLSLYDRIQIYRASSSSPSASASALTTLALVLHTTPGPSSLLSSLAKMRAKSVWEDAKRAAAPSPSPSAKAKGAPSVAHALVFDEVKTAEQALEMLASRLPIPTEGQQGEDGRADTPLDVLARMVVKQRVKRHLGKLFVRAVAASSAPSALDTEEDFITFGSASSSSASGAQGPSQEEDEEKRAEREEREWRRTIDAAREVGGKVEDLGRLFERVWKAPAALEVEDEEEVEEVFGIRASSPSSDDRDVPASSDESDDAVDHEIRALLVALVLYRRLFPPTAQPERKLPLTQEEEEGCVTPTGISQVSALLSPPPSPRSTPRARQRRRLDGSSGPSKVNYQDGDEEDGECEDEDEEGDGEDEQAHLEAARYKRMLFVLRSALGSRVFEQHAEEVKEADGLDASVSAVGVHADADGDGDEYEYEGLLEDARDRVVDLIVDVERRECRRCAGGGGVL